ncbi:hypothetical protein SAMN06297129_0086 [Pseudooceanicola antarcticus]|uniref:Uncharacterized protein n=1 Tax=Pseudooceanicola antarcticus TaxID=1247613 RepID=A0A285HM16_9RHOB|nr:hypothetical protein [Pseudooceanicola antarcticus]PJE27935.1 hypothetical protein CVM39_15345 [Pseudooceanicola antarcticus]SNY35806.1 hypothetical protein SAMN06297129_0086 [Pseudooceanicola antarcticus]
MPISDQNRAGRESAPARFLPEAMAGRESAPARFVTRLRALRPAARPLAALAACLALSGCLDTPGAPGGGAFRKVENGGGLGIFSSLRRPMGPVLVTAQAASGNVVIRGPEDYCIEGRSLKSDSKRTFALLARCDILSGGEMGSPVALALLTATVTPFDGELPDAQALARDMAALEVLEYLDRGEVRLLHLGQGGDALVRGADPRQWRAVFTLNGQAVTLAAYGPQDSSVAGLGGRSLLLAMARAIRAASPDGPANQELTAAAPALEDQTPGLGSTLNAPSMAEGEDPAAE